METAIFKSYDNGYFTFKHDHGEEIVYEEIVPWILDEYDLRNDKNYIGKTFEITHSEVLADDDFDLVIYRIKHLKLVD